MLRTVRLLLVAVVVAATASVGVLFPAGGRPPGPVQPHLQLRPLSSEQGGDAGDEAEEWYFNQRSAPANSVAPNAFAAVAGEAARLPSVGGAWREFTQGRFFSDSAAYHDQTFPVNAPATTNSNSGAGDRFVSGRLTALAAAADHTLFAGVSSGGVWRSPDGGAHWQPLLDGGPTMSIGALAVDNSRGHPYTVYVGTGEANFADSYAGVGVLVSTDGGNHFNRLGGGALNGAVIFRVVVDPVDPRRVYAATSHGLYRIVTGPGAKWRRILSFDTQYQGGERTPLNERSWDAITDVVVLPGTGGGAGHVLAVAGWLGGAPTNGLYLSANGGDSFSSVGWVRPVEWKPARPGHAGCVRVGGSALCGSAEH